MKARAPIWRKLAEEHLAKGMSHREVAEALGLPVGTVKTWRHLQKKQADKSVRAPIKPDMKPASAKGKAADMKPGTKPAKLATFRGITALDLPGRTREIQSLNFAAMKLGKYPPRSAGIPGYLEGPELGAALRAWCEKWKGRKK